MPRNTVESSGMKIIINIAAVHCLPIFWFGVLKFIIHHFEDCSAQLEFSQYIVNVLITPMSL